MKHMIRGLKRRFREDPALDLGGIFAILGVLVATVFFAVLDRDIVVVAGWVQLVVTVGVAVVMGVVTVVVAKRRRFGEWGQDHSVDGRLKQLRVHIDSATLLFRDLQDELEVRTKLLQQLEDKATDYRALAELNEESARAVERLFKRQGRLPNWISFLSLLVGVGSLVITLILA